MPKTMYAKLAALAALLTLVVVVFGAYVRLSDAGLGCPDWPGCYGHIGVPQTPEAIAQANLNHPDRQVEPAKAWKEMYHRYLAMGLGVLILLLAVTAWGSGIPVMLPMLLVALVGLQGVLGMLTVTMLVKPLIVTTHLAGGLATLMLLWWLALRSGHWFLGPVSPSLTKIRGWIWLGMVFVIVQVLLGGWTSTNYAAVACVEFPTCYAGYMWPPMDFHAGFNLLQGLGSSITYEGGVLESPARVAIQMVHRIGALVVLVYIMVLSLQIMLRAVTVAQVSFGVIVHLLILAQVGLGIAVVLNYRQLEVGVAHNGVAALLLITMVTLLHITKPPSTYKTAVPGARARAS